MKKAAFFALVALMGLSMSPEIPEVRADDDECSPKECPLHHWMEENTTKAVEDGDTKALAAALHKIEFMAPDKKWDEGKNSWAKIAREGATAAEKGDLKLARKSCKNCHKAWRKDYQKMFKDRPVPKLPKDADKGRKDLK
ncbi:MAG: hypothetical protein KC416_02590 [Myxococcales bacterium]|nr:hypothetical protein [Myxococcales bacterium]